MKKWHFLHSFLRSVVLGLTCALTACSTVQTPSAADPFEGFNRTVFTFNEAVDRAALKPVAKTYNRALPRKVRASVTNFFANIGDFYTMLNDLLQGNIKAGAEDMMRITINSLFGVVGFFDVATEAGIPKHQQDFGQTLGFYGMNSGPYLVLPLLGPSTVRDTAGLIVDRLADPTSYIHPNSARTSLYGLRLVNTRASLLQATNLFSKVAFDKYSFTRDAFLQHRRYLIRGSDAGFDYEDEDEGEALAPGESVQPRAVANPNPIDSATPPPGTASATKPAPAAATSSTRANLAEPIPESEADEHRGVPPSHILPPVNYFPNFRLP